MFFIVGILQVSVIFDDRQSNSLILSMIGRMWHQCTEKHPPSTEIFSTCFELSHIPYSLSFQGEIKPIPDGFLDRLCNNFEQWDWRTSAHTPCPSCTGLSFSQVNSTLPCFNYLLINLTAFSHPLLSGHAFCLILTWDWFHQSRIVAYNTSTESISKMPVGYEISAWTSLSGYLMAFSLLCSSRYPMIQWRVNLLSLVTCSSCCGSGGLRKLPVQDPRPPVIVDGLTIFLGSTKTRAMQVRLH